MRVVAFLCLAACGFQPSSSTSDASPDGQLTPPTDARSLPACGAQRTLHIVGGVGGFAWFSLAWPVPATIEQFDATFPYDDTSLVTSVDTGQPLYARRHGVGTPAPLWQGTGVAPQPTAFTIGTNETHTQMPTSAVTSAAGSSVVAQGAALQRDRLTPTFAAVVFGNAPYGSAPGAPVQVRVADIDEAIDALKLEVGLTAAEEEALRPDPVTLASWYADNTPSANLSELAEKMLFAANLFKAGHAGTIVLDTFNDDPHGAWNNLAVTASRADNLTNALHGFYLELASATEAECGDSSGAPLSLADNVVTIVNGDTPKNPFSSAGWPDGTINGQNRLYARTNGWVKSGWFGQLEPASQLNFNPDTGLVDANATDASNDSAAQNAILYAISRGDVAYVSVFDDSPYDGLVSPMLPD